jgi:hypothetical protein
VRDISSELGNHARCRQRHAGAEGVGTDTELTGGYASFRTRHPHTGSSKPPLRCSGTIALL